MNRKSIWGFAILAALLLCGAASAADTIAAGHVKRVNAEKREFVMVDGNNKEITFKLSDNTVMNRGGRESQSDLSGGDSVYVYHDAGLLTWTAKYVLIREGDSKNWELAHGKLKGYDGEKLNFTYTSDGGRDMTHSAAFARAWVNNREVQFDDLQIGDSVLLMFARSGGKTDLLWVMCERREY